MEKSPATMHNALNAKLLIPVVIISVLGGVFGGAVYTKRELSALPNESSGDSVSSQESNTITQRSYVEESQMIEAITKVSPAVISILGDKELQIMRQQNADPFQFFFENDPFFLPFGSPFGQVQPQQEKQENGGEEKRRQRVGSGTGFIVSADGLGLTNKHVVSDTDADYTAFLPDGTEYAIEIIDTDPLNDLAVIQLREKKEGTGKERFGEKAQGLAFADLGNSTDLRVGQRVLAIGNARGQYDNSVTSGIVSAIGREIQASDQGTGTSEVLSNLIQTDAAINFGNSGGPLVNLAGQVIGMNTAIDAGASGIGFAIPASEMAPVLESVRKDGRIIRPILGVRFTMLTKERAKELNLDGVEYGALLVGDRSKGEFAVLPGGPAEKAGLKTDDVILEVDGQRLTEENPLQSIVRTHRPGDTLKLKVWRDGKIFESSITLDEFKADTR